MKLAKFAWRNNWRRRRRTLITGSSIGFGLLLAVTFTGTGDYGYTNMINAGADLGLGHVTIEPLGYNQTPGLDKRLHQASDIQKTVLKDSGVKASFVRIMGQAMFASANKTIGGAFVAINPNNENGDHNLLIRSLVEGKLFSSSDGTGVVVGSQMASKLKLRIGKKIIYTTTDAQGEIVSAIARVTGIFKTGVKELDSGMVLLPIDKVRLHLNYQPDDATLVAVIVHDQRYAAKVQRRIANAIPIENREVLSWKQTQADLAGIIAMDRSGNYISQILVGVLIAAGIFNTLLMSVLERTREFGVMLAVGMTPGTLFKLVIVESFWLAIIGIVMGIIITAPWYAFLYFIGIDLTSSIGSDYNAGGVLIDPILKIRLFKESIVAIFVGIFTLTILSGLYPAWRAGRVAPVESLTTI